MAEERVWFEAERKEEESLSTVGLSSLIWIKVCSGVRPGLQ